jgi:Uncharacterized protein conserved in bacteria
MDADDVSPARPTTAKAEARRELDALDTSTLRRAANWFVLAGGTANVIMQLSRPPVAYGVMDSPVTEGNLFTNPKRRARTTVSYLAVTMLGTADERAEMRRATNRSHARIRSAAGARPAYDAFDPELQKWVTACLYVGAENAYRLTYGDLAPDERERFYREGMVFGTTLQLPAEAWPATRDDFGAYWDRSLDELEMDDRTREYLLRIVRLEYLGRRIPDRVLRLRTRLVGGHLGPRFRDLLGMPWDDGEQARFDRFNARLAGFLRRAPRAVREAPLARQLRDVRRRMTAGIPLF